MDSKTRALLGEIASRDTSTLAKEHHRLSELIEADLSDDDIRDAAIELLGTLESLRDRAQRILDENRPQPDTDITAGADYY